ncbi:hypothetical protein B566_EDAN015488, partial [Ephemera danica]
MVGGHASSTRDVCKETGDEWLRLGTASGDGARSQNISQDSSLSSVWKAELRLSSLSRDPNETSLELNTARPGATSDNQTTKHRKRKHQQSGRVPAPVTSQQAMQSPSLSSLTSLRTNVAPVGTPLAPDLATKSSSAPVLAKQHTSISNIAATSQAD